MSRLIKPIEYAKEQNISRQAVYAKIKKGLLDAKTVEGKMYVVLKEEELSHSNVSKPIPLTSSTHLVDAKELLASKDETISVLKDSIKDLKQTNTEINTTLRGEIELLKQVFAELRTLYIKQVDSMNEKKMLNQTQSVEAINETTQVEMEKAHSDDCWVDIETFLDRAHIIKEKKRKKVAKRLFRAFRNNDERIRMENDVLFMSCFDFYEDILKIKSE